MILSLLAAATLALAQPSPRPARILNFRIAGDPQTLDWNRAGTTIEQYLLDNIMEGLLTFDASMKPVPALASGWNVSEDGKTYTFKLRMGVKWTDGVPLKAADFVYSWKRLLSPATAANYAYILFDIEGAEAFHAGKSTDFSTVGVKALDDATLEVKLTRATANWLFVPTIWPAFPLRQDVVESRGKSWEKPGHLVTLGPFKVTAHDLDSRIVLSANPGYWGGRPFIDEAVGMIIRDGTKALTMYKEGKIDLLLGLGTSKEFAEISKRPDLKLYPFLRTVYLGFDVRRPSMSDPRLRKAIAAAIDREKIRFVLYGTQPATSFVPEGLVPGYSPRAAIDFDVGTAREAFKLTELKKAPSFELLVSDNERSISVAAFIRDELKKNLGIELTLVPAETKTFYKALADHAYPMFIGAWAADIPEADNFLSSFLAHSGNNFIGWKNDAYDALVITARDEKDPATRDKMYRDAQRILMREQAAVVPIYRDTHLALVQPRVKGLELTPLNYLILRNVTLDH